MAQDEPGPIKEHELPPFINNHPLNATALPEQLAPIFMIIKECQFYGVRDPSQVAYILASAKHESNMGQQILNYQVGISMKLTLV
jgi:hypothetical protein